MKKTLKSRLEELMTKNGIYKQTELLRKVFNYSINDPSTDAYEWAEKNKGNFNKMVNGEEGRKIPTNILIGLEHVLNTTADYLYTGASYDLTYKPHGIEYAVYIDTIDAYKDLNKETNGKEKIITEFNEYGKSLVDYIIQYEAINGIKFLSEEYNYIYNPIYNSFNAKDNTFFYSSNSNAAIEIAKIISKKGNAQLFYNIYKVFDDVNNFYGPNSNSAYYDSAFRNVIVSNDELFEKILVAQEMDLKEINHVKRTLCGFDKNSFVSPMIEDMLRDSINEGCLAVYENYESDMFDRAKRLAMFAIKHNESQIELVRANMDSIKHKVDIDNDGFLEVNGLRIGNFVDIAQKEDKNIPSDLLDLLKIIAQQKERFFKIADEYYAHLVEKEKSTLLSFEDLAGYIFTNTSIRQQFSSDSIVLSQIKSITNNFEMPETKKDFANNLLKAFENKFSDLEKNKSTYDKQTYNREYVDLLVAISFVKLHMDELNAF